MSFTAFEHIQYMEGHIYFKRTKEVLKVYNPNVYNSN